ncbi:MAG: aminoglycoside 2'-N-acetyltransferase, partial [Acidimicrobiia bacterium]|nr:aminoglycoside 2'-N-acetyltransferase [Acidimicrobiia bacterium]
MTDVLRVAHTWELTADELAAIRDLLDAAFEGGFSDHDW